MAHAPEVLAALKGCVGVMIPGGSQAHDGTVEINLGAKGIAELELISDGATWGRGPRLDVHSSLEAQIDSPAWRLVQALNTLVGPDGHTPAVEGFFDRVRPMTAADPLSTRAARRPMARMPPMRPPMPPWPGSMARRVSPWR